jgi:chromate transporter
MHRYLVNERAWLSDAQFSSSIALAQASPGPNVLFVALMGWNVGMNTGGYSQALLGVGVSMLGILLPSTTLTFLATRWGHQNRDLRGVRAFKQGLAPIVIALLVATGWVLSASLGKSLGNVPLWSVLPLWLVTLATAVIVWRSKIHLLWLLGAGALLGALGWV